MSPSTPDFRSMPCKLIAILRGIKNDEVEGITEVLLDSGITAIEVPLNSPNPIHSIERVVRKVETHATAPCLVGAGTVLTPNEVEAVHQVGGNLIVSPNIDPEVVQKTVALGMASFPGVFTATEAHAAIANGASGLKFFPASLLGATGIKAISATLPPDVLMCAVGGVDHTNMADYLSAGVVGFGLGSSLYKPGDTAKDVQYKTERTMAAWREHATVAR